jgi:acyl-CoA hydrolase
MVFRQPIKIGDLVILHRRSTYTGAPPMEAEVQVTAENPITGERTHTNTAYLVYVALDDDGKLIRSAPIAQRNMPRANRLPRRITSA